MSTALGRHETIIVSAHDCRLLFPSGNDQSDLDVVPSEVACSAGDLGTSRKVEK
ncbi:uncharacterized protein LY89DRAFT_117023 [Mollisia scopiformis]|uniref:Uncharacterized protein n=1 Tax=Mollisia scopiformis TaxID=149040 RepID=A0A194X6Z4_MOLSC|nr:uncharacterized protein LY89DRAFT_117023 [Mollisia scopiformis]KUJ15572.1 hypothetical protein LY89DRAFT_117023 [Mollisia scopiformis]